MALNAFRARRTGSCRGPGMNAFGMFQLPRLVPTGHAGSKVTIDANGAVVAYPRSKEARTRRRPFTRISVPRYQTRREAKAAARRVTLGAGYFKTITRPKWERMPHGAEETVGE